MRARAFLPWILVVGLACDRPATGPDASKRSATPADREGAAHETPDEPGAAPQVATPEPPKLPPLPKAGPLHYHEVMLGGAKPDDGVPMILAIHGLGDEPRNFAHLFATFPEKARLILPQGVDPTESGGWSWFPIRARDPDIDALSAGIEASADKLAEAMKVLAAQKPTRGEPIVTGFSQGGMLTMTLAVHHPEVVGQAVAVGGWLPPPLWPDGLQGDAKDYPDTIALHGTADNAVFYEPTKEAVDHLAKLGLPIELKSYEGVRHVITPEMQRDLYGALIDAVREQQRAPLPDSEEQP